MEISLSKYKKILLMLNLLCGISLAGCCDIWPTIHFDFSQLDSSQISTVIKQGSINNISEENLADQLKLLLPNPSVQNITNLGATCTKNSAICHYDGLIIIHIDANCSLRHTETRIYHIIFKFNKAQLDVSVHKNVTINFQSK